MSKKMYKLSRTSRKTNRTWEAYCEETDEGYYEIKAGSLISDEKLADDPSEKVKKLRSEASIDENRVLKENVRINNLLQAAEFVLNTNASPEHWKEI